MSALTRNRSTANVSNELMLKYYTQRAKGDAGLTVSKGILITRQGAEWQQAQGIWSHNLRGRRKSQTWFMRQRPAAEYMLSPALSARGGKFRFLPSQSGYVTLRFNQVDFLEPAQVDDPTKLIAQSKQAAINAEEAAWLGSLSRDTDDFSVRRYKRPSIPLGTSCARRTNRDCRMLLWYGITVTPTSNLTAKCAPRNTVFQTFSLFLTETNISSTRALRPPKPSSSSVAGVSGMNWILHPDLVRRFEVGKVLNNALDFMHLYGAEDVDLVLDTWTIKRRIHLWKFGIESTSDCYGVVYTN
ncbi:hypothetical protein C8R45DRAFT_1133137 [Mycena sanguinolenta]|nr:hypothetical protein C8R45DRAFT_1133137 [Mycena sanguinolenta]